MFFLILHINQKAKSYITYKSKSQRDSINKKVMNDPKMAEMSNIKMPFDVNKMSYGGFKVFVSE